MLWIAGNTSLGVSTVQSPEFDTRSNGLGAISAPTTMLLKPVQPARGLDRLQQHGGGRADGSQAVAPRVELRRLDGRHAQGSVPGDPKHLPAPRRGKKRGKCPLPR